MDRAKEILVGVDASESGLAAVRWAAAAASSRRVPLRIVAVLPRWAYEMPDQGRYAEVGQWAREDTGNVVDRARGVAAECHPDLEITADVLPGEVKVTLVEQAARASLLVVGTRGSGGLLDLLVGSVALTVAARADCPTVVVRQWTGGEPARRVLVAVDPAQPDPDVLEVAAAEARGRGAVLEMVAAVRRVTDLVGGSAERLRDEDEWYLEQDEEGLWQALSDLANDVRARHEGLEVDAEVRVGHPVTLLQDASRDADLLVVGRRQRRSQTPLGLGSVTRGLLGRSRCPVMVVPVQTADD